MALLFYEESRAVAMQSMRASKVIHPETKILLGVSKSSGDTCFLEKLSLRTLSSVWRGSKVPTTIWAGGRHMPASDLKEWYAKTTPPRSSTKKPPSRSTKKKSARNSAVPPESNIVAAHSNQSPSLRPFTPHQPIFSPGISRFFHPEQLLNLRRITPP